MRRLACFVLGVILSITLVGCGPSGNPERNKDKDVPDNEESTPASAKKKKK